MFCYYFSEIAKQMCSLVCLVLLLQGQRVYGMNWLLQRPFSWNMLHTTRKSQPARNSGGVQLKIIKLKSFACVKHVKGEASTSTSRGRGAVVNVFPFGSPILLKLVWQSKLLAHNSDLHIDTVRSGVQCTLWQWTWRLFVDTWRTLEELNWSLDLISTVLGIAEGAAPAA